MIKFIRKMLFRILIAALFVSITSCSTMKTSPGMWYLNMSNNYISDIEINWNGYDLWKLGPKKAPGQISIFNFAIIKHSDIFGPVHLRWKNAKGKLIEKKFIFRKDQLPNTKAHNFDNIYMFLTQSDMELFAQGGKEKEPKMVTKNWKKVTKFRKEFREICPSRNCRNLEKLRKKARKK